jgi:hypothetical protein
MAWVLNQAMVERITREEDHGGRVAQRAGGSPSMGDEVGEGG